MSCVNSETRQNLKRVLRITNMYLVLIANTQLVHRVSDAFLPLLVALPSSQRAFDVDPRLSLEGSKPQTELFAGCYSNCPSQKLPMYEGGITCEQYYI